MTAEQTAVLDQALTLDPNQRVQVAEQILHSVDPTGRGESEWNAELLERERQIESGEVKLLSEGEFMDQLREDGCVK